MMSEGHYNTSKTTDDNSDNVCGGDEQTAGQRAFGMDLVRLYFFLSSELMREHENCHRVYVDSNCGLIGEDEARNAMPAITARITLLQRQRKNVMKTLRREEMTVFAESKRDIEFLEYFILERRWMKRRVSYRGEDHILLRILLK